MIIASSKNKKGFTLIETLVAITIVTLAVIAPFEAIQRIIIASNISREQFIASFLAQEGAEYVRFVRYNNYLAHRNESNYADHILDGLENCISPNTCTVDASFNAPLPTVECSASSSCVPLQYNANTGVYSQQTGAGNASSMYTRSVQIEDHGDYQTVTVTVSWNDHGAHDMQISEDTYDWL
ncbi:MAG: prepilin-type N-terminal cleavage/methylation domain-containing protein [Minisyncoccia bacterium]